MFDSLGLLWLILIMSILTDPYIISLSMVFSLKSFFNVICLRNSYTLRYRCFWIRNLDGRRPEGFLIQKHRIPKCISSLHHRFFVKHPRLKYNILKLSYFYLYVVFNQQLKNTTNYIL